MNSFLGAVPPEPKPDFWYGLPQGYITLDLQPTVEGLQQMARHIGELPSEARGRAEQAFRLYGVVVMMLHKHRVQGCALGMHPDDNGNPSLSVLTVSTLPAPEANPKAALTQMLARAGTGPENGVVPMELPVGTGFLIESVQRTVAPITPPEGQEEPPEGRVWQGTVAIPEMRTSSVITVQLVTSALELSDDYRGVLLGVARTVTFTDPMAPAGANRSAGLFDSSGAGAMEKNPFG